MKVKLSLFQNLSNGIIFFYSCEEREVQDLNMFEGDFLISGWWQLWPCWSSGNDVDLECGTHNSIFNPGTFWKRFDYAKTLRMTK